MTSTLALSCLFAVAQDKEVTEYVFNPHWYLQGQVGVQETLGETSFGKLVSPTAQLGVGYNFNPYIGARLAINAWQSKGAFEYNNNRNVYKWNYVAPAIDVTADLTNAFGGFNPNRVVSVGVFAGIGANIGFSNNEAADVKQSLVAQGLANPLGLLWTGTKARFLGHFGAMLDFKVSNRVSLGIELQANIVPDSYNSKKADNSDWYFNGLAGIKINLGRTHTKKVTVIPAPVPLIDTVYVEKVVEKVVEKPVEVKKEINEPLIRRDVFFAIAKSNVSNEEMTKVADIASFLKANPDTKVSVTGYADKGTGSNDINIRLSKQRAQSVVDLLVKTYGISEDRIQMHSMDESFVQPFPDPIQNRVAICIVE